MDGDGDGVGGGGGGGLVYNIYLIKYTTYIGRLFKEIDMRRRVFSIYDSISKGRQKGGF
jgi:hypothetical protein